MAKYWTRARVCSSSMRSCLRCFSHSCSEQEKAMGFLVAAGFPDAIPKWTGWMEAWWMNFSFWLSISFLISLGIWVNPLAPQKVLFIDLMASTGIVTRMVALKSSLLDTCMCALCFSTGNWCNCCTNATSISVCASSTAHSSSQSRSKQIASYSVWVVLAGCYTFFNILQCSNDKRKRAVRIWVVIAGNFTMLAMLASLYFMCVDCMDGRPKKSSMGGVAKGNLWPFEFMAAQICGNPKLKSPCKTMLKLSCSLETNQERTPMWRRNHFWTDMIKMSTNLLVSKCSQLQYKCEIKTWWTPLRINMSIRNLSQIPHLDLPKSSCQVDWQTCQVQSVAAGKDRNIQRLYQRSRPLGYKSHCPAPQAKAPH